MDLANYSEYSDFHKVATEKQGQIAQDFYTVMNRRRSIRNFF